MMKKNPAHGDEAPIPSLAEFLAWPSEQVQPHVREKAVVFSPGGSSRWYFLEHGDASVGYDSPEAFRDYARRSFDRILELADLMFADGIRTVFVIGVTPKQSSRDPDYNQNLTAATRLLVDQASLESYELYEMGVLFRGGWERAFEKMGAAQVMEDCLALEQDTAPFRERWLVWVAADEPIPQALVPVVKKALEETGEMPARSALCEAYYGRGLTHADIFIGNNKPTIEGQSPPLLTLGDLYFTVSPSYYVDRPQWRTILYDHLFARRVRYRDWAAIGPEDMEEMRAFYQANQGVTLGVGRHHAPSQTWRPHLSTGADGASPD
jgi:hypothetical protein